VRLTTEHLLRKTEPATDERTWARAGSLSSKDRRHARAAGTALFTGGLVEPLVIVSAVAAVGVATALLATASASLLLSAALLGGWSAAWSP
jgi:hypothetical protein